MDKSNADLHSECFLLHLNNFHHEQLLHPKDLHLRVRHLSCTDTHDVLMMSTPKHFPLDLKLQISTPLIHEFQLQLCLQLSFQNLHLR